MQMTGAKYMTIVYFLDWNELSNREVLISDDDQA